MKYVDASARIYTDWSPNCSLNYNLQTKYNTNNIHEYKYYLQANATNVMKDLLPNADDCKLCKVCQASLVYKPMSYNNINGSNIQ